MIKLQFLTSYSQANKLKFEYMVRKVIDAGVPAIQFCWEGTDLEIFQKAEWTRKVTQDNNVDLVINNRIDIALAVHPEAVHLGQNDFPFDLARDILPNDIKMGLTLDKVEDYFNASDKVDYYGIGPVFKTTTKYQDRQLLGLDGISKLRELTNKPLVAIGGITTNNVKEVIESGADGVAVIGDIYRSSNIRRTVKDLHTSY